VNMRWAKAHFFISDRQFGNMPVIKDEALLDRITKLSEQSTAGTGLEIADVELRGSGTARLLRVYIDKPGGVTHGDCELVSERLGVLLDEFDVIPGDSYTLEVSSPGVERKLSKARDFERAVGQDIRVALREAINSQKHLEGKLAGFAGDTLEVETTPGTVLKIPLPSVQKANLKFRW
jgi:ribosome maturation factor RimP